MISSEAKLQFYKMMYVGNPVHIHVYSKYPARRDKLELEDIVLEFTKFISLQTNISNHLSRKSRL